MVIGLMGGIGSGKSTVLNYLESNYNAYIIQSDFVAKEIMTSGHDVFEKICDIFPEAVSENEIDSKKLSEIVFADEEKLKLLNSITHPATVKEIAGRIKESKEDIVVVESALLIGSGLEKYCDEIWFVFCEMQKRIERLINDRGYTREKAESIIAKQLSDDEYNASADEFIDNTYSVEKTREQVDMLLSMQPCSF